MIDLDSLRGIVARAAGTGWQAAYRQDVAALIAEVERLRAVVADQQMLLDEHRMDNQHAYEEGGHAERAAVVAWLRSQEEAAMDVGFVRRASTLNVVADAIERGEHRREAAP